MAMDEVRGANDAARGAQGVGSGAGGSGRQQLSTFVTDRVREQIARDGLPSGRLLRVEALALAERAVRLMSALGVERLEVIHGRHELAMDQGDQARAAASGRQFHRLPNRVVRAPRLALPLGNLAQQLPGYCSPVTFTRRHHKQASF